MDESIVICEKPDSLSWEQISDVLVFSHAENRKKGVFLPYPHLPPDEIRKKIEGKGVMLVAMKGVELVGTSAIVFIKRRIWCGSGKYAYCCFASVSPNHSGQGIYRRLLEEREKIALSRGYKRMLFDTHEGNSRVIAITKKAGFRPVDYRIRKDHNSILMAKWLDKQPYPDFVISLVFTLLRRSKLIQKGLKSAFHR